MKISYFGFCKVIVRMLAYLLSLVRSIWLVYAKVSIIQHISLHGISKHGLVEFGCTMAVVFAEKRIIDYYLTNLAAQNGKHF